MKCSQTQLFQGVFSALPFFSTTQCSRTQSFSQTTPQKLKQQRPKPCSTPGTSLSLPTAFQVQESRWLYFLFPSLHSPILAAEMLLTRKKKKNTPQRWGVVKYSARPSEPGAGGKKYPQAETIFPCSFLTKPFPGCPQPRRSPALPGASPARRGWPSPAPLCHRAEMEWGEGNNPHEMKPRRDNLPLGTSLPHHLTFPTPV